MITYNNPSQFQFNISSDRVGKVNTILADAGIRIDSLLVFGSVLDRSIETIYSNYSVLVVPDNIFDQFITDLVSVEVGYARLHDGQYATDLSSDASMLVISSADAKSYPVSSFDFLGIQLIRATSVNNSMTEL